MTEEEKKARKAEQQHRAWKKWYESPKGQEYYQKRKVREIAKPQICEGCEDQNCRINGCMA